MTPRLPMILVPALGLALLLAAPAEAGRQHLDMDWGGGYDGAKLGDWGDHDWTDWDCDGTRAFHGGALFPRLFGGKGGPFGDFDPGDYLPKGDGYDGKHWLIHRQFRIIRLLLRELRILHFLLHKKKKDDGKGGDMPEPGAVFLTALGLGALVGMRRRSRVG